MGELKRSGANGAQRKSRLPLLTNLYRQDGSSVGAGELKDKLVRFDETDADGNRVQHFRANDLLLYPTVKGACRKPLELTPKLGEYRILYSYWRSICIFT